MADLTFALQTTVTASTKRPPAKSGGKRGAPAENVASLSCTPLDPVDSELRARLGLQASMELLQTFVQSGVDIVEGDLLVVGSTEYPVRAVGEWTWPLDSADTLHIIIEDLKTS